MPKQHKRPKKGSEASQTVATSQYSPFRSRHRVVSPRPASSACIGGVAPPVAGSIVAKTDQQGAAPSSGGWASAPTTPSHSRRARAAARARWARSARQGMSLGLWTRRPVLELVRVRRNAFSTAALAAHVASAPDEAAADVLRRFAVVTVGRCVSRADSIIAGGVGSCHWSSPENSGVRCAITGRDFPIPWKTGQRRPCSQQLLYSATTIILLNPPNKYE